MATLEHSLAGPSRPLGSPEIPQFHLPTRSEKGVYAPWLYGSARIHFVDGKRKFDEVRRVAFRVPLRPDTKTLDWDVAEAVDVLPEGLLSGAPVAAPYLPLPAGAMDTKAFTRWAKNFDRWLARTQRLRVAAKGDAPAAPALSPKRGGVSVDLVAIVWDLVW